MLCNGSARPGHPGLLESGLQLFDRGLSPIPSRFFCLTATWLSHCLCNIVDILPQKPHLSTVFRIILYFNSTFIALTDFHLIPFSILTYYSESASAHNSTFLITKLFMSELSDGKQNIAYRCKRISRSKTGTKI